MITRKNKVQFISAALGAASILSATAAYSQEEGPPRGPDVGQGAAMCKIGPFPQIAKAGQYNVLCNTMPDAEKCLAIVKDQMSSMGEITPDSRLQERAEYCLETFRRELLKEIE